MGLCDTFDPLQLLGLEVPAKSQEAAHCSGSKHKNAYGHIPFQVYLTRIARLTTTTTTYISADHAAVPHRGSHELTTVTMRTMEALLLTNNSLLEPWIEAVEAKKHLDYPIT